VPKWLTIVAQILNFLILVWLLKRFLYGRIIKAMDERQAKIAAQLDEAEQKRGEAEQEAAGYRQKSEELDAEREELMAKAKEEVEAHRAELMKQARAEVDALEARWRESVERQRAAFLQDLRQRAAKQTFAIARRALGDLAGADLEARIIDVFIGRLESLPDGEWQALAASARGDDDDEKRELAIRSVFDLPEDKRQRLGEIVRTRCGDGFELRFETSFDPISGIELLGEGRKVAWSIEHYLGSLEESLAEAMEQLPSAARLKAERERDVEREEGEEQSAVGSRQEAKEGKQESEQEQEQEQEKEGRTEDEDDDEDEG